MSSFTFFSKSENDPNGGDAGGFGEGTVGYNAQYDLTGATGTAPEPEPMPDPSQTRPYETTWMPRVAADPLAIAAYGVKRILNKNAQLPPAPPSERGDACTAAGEHVFLVDRMDAHGGVAFPLDTEPGAMDNSALAAAWLVRDAATPVTASPGRVIASLALPCHTFDRVDMDDDTSVRRDIYKNHMLHFFNVEFTDAGGVAHRCWSDALWCWFADGEDVTVYWYWAADGAGNYFLRVHDIASARLPVNVGEHAVQTFGFTWSDTADVIVSGHAKVKRGVRRVDGVEKPYATVSMFAWGNQDINAHGSFDTWADSQPWGRPYRYVTQMGYQTNRQPLRSTFLGRDERSRLSLTIPQDELAVGFDDPQSREARNHPSRFTLHQYRGTVESVVVVPLFNRRRYCGNGYMALVEFDHKGKRKQEWTFGTPLRADSYLGDGPIVRDPPLRPGDAADVLWGDAFPCFASPVR